MELRNVSFGYNPLGAPLIEGLSVTIEPGERVAFVGASGSGKSTITKLIAGLYEPSSGEILFDHYPRATVPREVLTNSLAVVEQDFSLFEGTVSENITFGTAAFRPNRSRRHAGTRWSTMRFPRCPGVTAAACSKAPPT